MLVFHGGVGAALDVGPRVFLPVAFPPVSSHLRPLDAASGHKERAFWIKLPRRQANNTSQQALKYRVPVLERDFGLYGLVENAIETLDEGGWVFERDSFEKEGLVEE